jgi:hypothetical protein
MKRAIYFTTLISFVFLGLSFFPLKTNAVGPFGGSILEIEGCNTGLKILLGPPTAGYFMFLPSTIFFPLGPPSHTGQWLLGMSGPPTPCFDGPVVIGYGDAIIFHGSSL